MTKEKFEELKHGDKIIFLDAVKNHVFDYWIIKKIKLNKTINGKSVIGHAHTGNGKWTEITVNDCGNYELLKEVYKTHAEYFI